MSGTSASMASLFLVLALAGCLGDDGEEELLDPGVDVGGPAALPAAGDVDPAGVPAWALGDFWVFTNSNGARAAFVVTEDLGMDWRMDSDGDDYAFYDALTDISTLGPQRKSDLAGSQGPDRVEFFRWPLADKASWGTRWDGYDVTVTVASRADGTFGFRADRADGTLHASYTYSPITRWFTELSFFNPDGSTQFSSTVVESGRNWTGNVLRYSLAEVFLASDADAPEPANVQLVEFTEPDSATDLFLSLQGSCSAGWFHFSLEPGSESDGDPGYTTDPNVCPAAYGFEGVVGHVPGQWGITLAYASPEGVPAFFARVLVRTLSEVEVG